MVSVDMLSSDSSFYIYHLALSIAQLRPKGWPKPDCPVAFVYFVGLSANQG
ncbi:Uncharacterised protein [Vibrio cholerae]|nr:Uncharacterised protein [Vibrio cholerae]